MQGFPLSPQPERESEAQWHKLSDLCKSDWGYTRKAFRQSYQILHPLFSQAGRDTEHCYLSSIYTDFEKLMLNPDQDCIKRQIFSC